ncbi:7TM-DISM domain-containing protein [Peptoclostridium litorale]|uniref:7TM-DISM domain-containing protein n=1 Tax=Peptoclostridium litorale TaxID=1557 RepID=UPI000571031D|nr:7TM-DISM domain-containing protein [Peptoclostridium litorale]
MNIYNAHDGTLDLSGQTFDDNTVYKMRGEWKIAWNQFLDPVKDLQKIKDLDTCVVVPHTWSRLQLDDTSIGNQGFGTLVLDIDTGIEPVSLAVKSTYITSAFDMYANGTLIASNGNIGETPNSVRAMWHPVVGTIGENNGKIQLVIHFSNFNHRRFVIKDFYIGSESAISNHKNNRLAMDLIAFGSIFIMGLYHFMIYILRRRDSASLFFSLLCFSYAGRTLMVGDRFVYEIFPDIPWELFMKLAYITFYITAVSIVLFVQRTFSTFNHTYVKKLMVASTSIAVVSTVILPHVYSTYYLCLLNLCC